MAKAPPDARTRILRAALDVAAADGIAALTNRRVAAKASVSLGSLTYHFPNQEELLRGALNLQVDDEVARLEAIADDFRARRPTPGELAREIQGLAARSADRPELLAEFELYLHSARDPALQSASARCFAAYEKIATAALAAFAVSRPDRHATAVVALMLGFGLMQLGSGRHDAAGLVEGLRAIVQGAQAGGKRIERAQ